MNRTLTKYALHLNSENFLNIYFGISFTEAARHFLNNAESFKIPIFLNICKAFHVWMDSISYSVERHDCI